MVVHIVFCQMEVVEEKEWKMKLKFAIAMNVKVEFYHSIISLNRFPTRILTVNYKFQFDERKI